MGYIGIKNNKVQKILGDRGRVENNDCVGDRKFSLSDGDIGKEILWQRKYGCSLRIWNHTVKTK